MAHLIKIKYPEKTESVICVIDQSARDNRTVCGNDVTDPDENHLELLTKPFVRSWDCCTCPECRRIIEYFKSLT